MPYDEERRERLSALGKAALGIGAATAFFTRTDMGRTVLENQSRWVRSALINTSEAMRGKTIKNMWGHGKADLTAGLRAFSEGLSKQADDLIDIPTSSYNLVGAIQQLKNIENNREGLLTSIFNKQIAPNHMKEMMIGKLGKSYTGLSKQDKLIKDRAMNEIIENVLHDYNKYVDYENVDGMPMFSDRVLHKIGKHFGTKKDDMVESLKIELASFAEMRKEFLTSPEASLLFDNIQAGFEKYENYGERFQDSFFEKKVLALNSATVKDVLANREKFKDVALKGSKADEKDDFFFDRLQKLVDKDERFGDLVIDHALKFKDGKFYNYSPIKGAKESFQDAVMRNAGRLLKPLEEARNMKKAPFFSYIPKGSLDYLLDKDGIAQKDYVRIIDKTYSLSANGLEHVPEADNFYLTPERGFGGSMLRQMTGNVDFALEGHQGILKKLGFEKKSGITGRQKINISHIQKKVPSSYDEAIYYFNEALKENKEVDFESSLKGFRAVRNLIEDVDDQADLPTMESIRRFKQILENQNQPETVGVLRELNTILKTDDELDEWLNNTGYQKGAHNRDLRHIINSYKKDPLGAPERTYYRNGKRVSFYDEVRREVFKEASMRWESGDYTGNSYLNFLFNVRAAAASEKDLFSMTLLGHQAYMQKHTGVSLRGPHVINEKTIRDRDSIENITKLLYPNETPIAFAEILQPVATAKARSRRINELSEILDAEQTSKAMRPNQYVHMRKSINVLDIIQNINDGQKVTSGIKQLFAGGNNPQDITTASLMPYFALFRLSNDLKKSGLQLSRENTTDVWSLIKGFTLKRGLPAYGILFGLSYLNFEAENFTGRSFGAMAAQTTARFDIGIRKMLDVAQSPLKDAYYWFTPLNYLSDGPYQTAEERKEWYETGYSPVKGNRFWSLGDSEYFGGAVTYYQPNYVRRSEVNWRDIGVYGSSDDKWKHSILPTPRHPLSTVRYLLNPYWLEEKHKFDRPYMVSGSMFDSNTPWGAIGNATIGRLIKPSKPLNREYITDSGVDIRSIIEAENERIKDMARSQNTISIKSTDTGIEMATNIGYGSGGYTSGGSLLPGDSSGIGGYILHRDRVINSPRSYLSQKDRIEIGIASMMGERDRVINQIQAMNYAVKEKAKWSYGNDVQYSRDIDKYSAFSNMDLIKDPSVAADLRNLDSTKDQLRDISYSIGQLTGIYNFLGEFAIPSVKRYAYARSSDMTSMSNHFWETGIGGFDPNGAMEIIRRFIPHEDRNRIRVNPLRNNMPDWLPERFRNGDPYTLIKKGEMRLPGAGYEAMYGIDNYLDMSIGPSALGKSVEEIKQTMIGSQIGINQKILDSADEGTALHKEYEKMLLDSGMALSTEGEIIDEKNKIRGFYDVLLKDNTAREGRAIMDIKTVSDSVFKQISSGAKAEHLAQVNYYLGMTGLSKGYVFYVNRDNPNQTMSYNINFSQAIYEDSLAKVREARKQLTQEIKKGMFSPYAFYDDFTRFKILADVAPGSAEYKQYKQLISQNMPKDKQKEYQDILKRVEVQSKKHRFFNYKFVNVNVDHQKGVIESIDNKGGIKLVGDNTTYTLAGLSNYQAKINKYLAPGMRVQMEFEKNYNNSKQVQAAIYSGGLNVNRSIAKNGDADRQDDGSAMATRAMLTKNQIALGAPFEILAHMPIPFIHNKFMRVDSPYESWLKENVYGKKFSSWFNPIDTLLKPAFQQAWGSNYLQGMLGAGLFAYNTYMSDVVLTQGKRRALNLANMAFVPGHFVGDVAERVLTLNIGGKTSGKGSQIASAVALSGYVLANSNNPFVSLPAGVGLGYAAAEFLEEGLGKKGATIGLVAGLTLTAAKTGFKPQKMDQRYLPKDVKKRWAIEEYFDRLEYIKYKGLYEKTARLALDKEGVNIKAIMNNMAYKEKNAEKKIKELTIAKENIKYSALPQERKQALLEKIDAEINSYVNPNVDIPATPYARLALGYKQAMESTVYALDETSSWSQILRALEPYERDYFLEFAKERDPKKQDEILEVVSPYKQKVLQNLWGMKVKKQKSNADYFKSHKLPHMLWRGWNADKDLDSYKIKTIENEGMLLSDFGYYESERYKPEHQTASPIHYQASTSPLTLKMNLQAAMNGLGITDSEVSILPSQQSGIQTFMNLTTINKHRFQQAIDRL